MLATNVIQESFNEERSRDTPTKIKEQDENNFIFSRLITFRMSQDLSSVTAEILLFFT